MTTFTAFTTLSERHRAEALGEAMERLDPAPTGIGVIEVEDGSHIWEVGGYFTEAPDETGLALLAAAFDARSFVVSTLPDIDWVQHVKRQLAPVRAGRFFLYGSHDADKVPADAIALKIDAAMAFGTGHHATTRGCLLALDRLAADGFAPRRTADIGCGTAVLAMAAARLWPGPGHRVLAGDIDPVAVETATANLALNGLADAVHCVTSAGFDDAALTRAAPFDLVFANILKGPLISLAPDMARAAAPGAAVILSGILGPQAAEVCGAFEAGGFALADRLDLGDWATLTLRMPKI